MTNKIYANYTINKGQFYDDWLKDYMFYAESEQKHIENNQKCSNCDRKCGKMMNNDRN